MCVLFDLFRFSTSSPGEVSANESVMYYGPRESHADFAHPNFVPTFLDEVPEEIKRTAEELCGVINIACIYDYIATGSSVFARAASNTAGIIAETENIVSK